MREYEIEQVLADPGGVFAQPVTAAEPRTKLRTILPWVAASRCSAAIIAGVAVWKLKNHPNRGESCVLPTNCRRASNSVNIICSISLAVSPDGSQFVYGTTEGLYLRSVDELDARLIAGTDKDSDQPFFSPDGQWIGYLSQSDQKLKKVAISGGAPVVLCDTSGFVLRCELEFR